MEINKLIQLLIQGINTTDEIARGSFLHRSLAHDCIFAGSTLTNTIHSRYDLFQQFQKERHKRQNVKIERTGTLVADDNGFTQPCHLVDGNGDVLAAGSISGRKTKSGDLIQEVNFKLALIDNNALEQGDATKELS